MGPGSVRSGSQRTEQTLTDAGLKRRVGLEVGTRVGRYEILHRLGSGGMGSVYAALDPELGRRIAIKLLHDTPSANVPGGQQQLLREAQAMAAFSHPNVITVHDVGTHRGRVFLAMDWVRGPTLRTWMKDRPWSEVLPAVLQAGRGLAAVHAAGLVHRDFKPTNVMLHPDGRVVVMDFGLAARDRNVEVGGELSGPLDSAASTQDEEISGRGSIKGTPAYMSPEQHLAFEVDARADQFSFCVAAFEALYGRRPFKARTVSELLMRISAGEIVEMPEARVPGPIRRVLVRGLAEDAHARWPSMGVLLERLEPRRRRARTAAWVVAGAVGVTTLSIVAQPEPDTCATSAEEVRERWTPQRRESLTEALTMSERAFAVDTARRVDQILDAYVDQLAQAYDQACTQEVAPALLDRRTACLRQRTGALEATIDVLTTRDEDMVNRALKVVDSLPEVAPCLRAEHLAHEAATPADPQRSAQVERTRDALSHARALEKAGNVESALAEARVTLALARECDFAPVESEALNVYAAALTAAGEYSASADASEEAFHTARACHHDVVATQAAIDLVYTTGYRMREREVAEVWVRHAEALLEQASNDDEQRQRAAIMLRSNQAALAYSAGDYGVAADAFREIATLRTRLLGEDHPDVAAAHSNLGLALTKLGDKRAALLHHERALSSWRTSLGPAHPLVAISVHNRALVLESLERFEEAANGYAEAVKLRTRSQGARHPGVGLSTNNLGFVRGAQGRHQDALRLHQEALSIWTEAHGENHPRVASALSGVAAAMLGLERIDEARSFALRSLQTLERVVGSEHPDYALALQTLAEIEIARGDEDAARDALLRARAIAEVKWSEDSKFNLELSAQLAKIEASSSTGT